MLAYLLAVVASIVVGVLWAIVSGSPPSSFGLILIAFVFLGTAASWNRFRRHSSHDPVASPVLISPPATEEPKACETTSSGVTAPKADRMIGTVVDGRLMLRPEEMERVVKAPTEFANVLPLAEPQNPGELQSNAWFLAMGPKSGVFFDQRCSQIWSVTPETIELPDIGTSRRIPTWKMPTVRSIDGRRQKVTVEHWQLNALRAWKAKTYDDYLKTDNIFPDGWGVWAWETVVDSPLTWALGWQQPRQNLAQALNELAANPILLRQLLSEISRAPQDLQGLFKVKTAVDRLIENIRGHGIPDSHPFFAVLADWKSSRKRRDRILIVALVVLLLGLAGFLGYYLLTSP